MQGEPLFTFFFQNNSQTASVSDSETGEKWSLEMFDPGTKSIANHKIKTIRFLSTESITKCLLYLAGSCWIYCHILEAIFVTFRIYTWARHNCVWKARMILGQDIRGSCRKEVPVCPVTQGLAWPWTRVVLSKYIVLYFPICTITGAVVRVTSHSMGYPLIVSTTTGILIEHTEMQHWAAFLELQEAPESVMASA